MLAKKYKLAKEDYIWVSKGGIKIAGGWYGIIWKKYSDQQSRFSMVIPAKSIAKPTDRNSLKRKVYQVVEKYVPSSQKGIKALLRVFRNPTEAEETEGLKRLNDMAKQLF